MANSKKRKHSRALFEVISKSQNHARRPAVNGDRLRRRGFFSAARLWLGGNGGGAVGEGAGITSTGRVGGPGAGAGAAPVDADTAGVPAAVVVAEPIVEEAREDGGAYDAPAAARADYPELDAGERAQNLAVAVDPDRRQIALRMSYTVAIVGGFAVVVVVILSVMVGQRLNRGGSPLLAQTTTDELRKGPAHREVLDPPRRSTPIAGTGGADASSPRQNPRPAGGGGGQSDGQQQQSQQPTAAPADGKRYLNYNYVIIQGYAETQMKMAEEARDFLNREGVPCTVEKDVKNFAKITVVGLEGFERKSAPEVAAYCQRIKQLSSKYVGDKNRSYKAFDPVVVKWLKAD
jgi:hypothetical protein